MAKRSSGPTVIRALRAVVFQEGDWICAQILDYDMSAQAKTQEGLYRELQRVVIAHAVARLQHGQEPFEGVPRAPKKLWDMFKRSKIRLPMQKLQLTVKKPALKIQPPELRVSAG